MKSVLTIMMGLPCSGKKDWVDENKGDAVVVDLDWVRHIIFNQPNSITSNPFTQAIAESMVTLLLTQQKNVIVVSCNLTKEERDVWCDMASVHSVNHRIVFIDTPIDVCCERNEQRPPDEQLFKDKLRSLQVRLEKPSKHVHGLNLEVVK